MSFLSQLQSKLKGGLKPTTTKTTFPDGSVQLSSSSGEYSCEKKSGESYGFVVDEKPDLTLGRIRPWLLISSQDVPNDESLVRENGITHILSLLPGFILQENVKCLIKHHLILDIYDEECFELKDGVGGILQNCFNFIDGAKRDSEGNEKSVILVHCNAGISRAPSIAISYLMCRENLDFEQAWEQVKSVRPGMRPNVGFVKQLKNLNLNDKR